MRGKDGVSTEEPRIFTGPDIQGESSMEATRAENTLLHGALSGQIIGAFFEVYNELGFGFVESVYQRALPRALFDRGVPSDREVPFEVFYRSESIGRYRADLIVDGKVVVEIKAADRISPRP
jgi:GxxExxY protein